MTYLTAADAIGAKQSYRYYVELASEQRNFEGVPEFTRTIDVVVTQPTADAIASTVAACNWLKGYFVVSYNEPSNDYLVLIHDAGLGLAAPSLKK